MLRDLRSLPDHPRDGAPVIVLLHGRGSDMGDLMRLRPVLPAGAIVATPQAPFPAAPWGYGDGWAWYRFLGGATPDPASFEEGQERLATYLQALPALLPVQPGKLILGGFSQGGTSALAYALRNPGQVAGVLNFSGFLADHPSVRATPQTVAHTRFFWGHGQLDPAIPFMLAEEGRAALRAAGAALEIYDAPIGHGIDPAEVRAAMRWLAEVLDTRERPVTAAAHPDDARRAQIARGLSPALKATKPTSGG